MDLVYQRVYKRNEKDTYNETIINRIWPGDYDLRAAFRYRSHKKGGADILMDMSAIMKKIVRMLSKFNFSFDEFSITCNYEEYLTVM